MNPMQFASRPSGCFFFWELNETPVLIHFEDVLSVLIRAFCFGHSQSGKGDCIHKDSVR